MKTLEVIALILTDSHTRQADTTAKEMGVWGFDGQDACWMDEELEYHVWLGGEEGQGQVWAATPVLTSRQ